MMTRPGFVQGPAIIQSDDGQLALRPDLQLIVDMVEPGARLLDIGCGDGALLHFLSRVKGVDARGMELSQKGVNESVARGLSVIQGDADADLDYYPDGAFDYAILSQTIQATRNPRKALDDLVRIGRHAIVSFPNFGYWRYRLYLLGRGRMPRTGSLPYRWYDTPNIHFCTITDFAEMCAELGITVDRCIPLREIGKPARVAKGPLANLFAAGALFLLSRR